MENDIFEEASLLYGDAIYRVACHALGDRIEAEDVTQTVLLRLYQHQGSFESEEHRRHWIFRVAVNESRKALRSPWRKRVVPLEEWDGPAEETGAGEVLEAVMALEAKYLRPMRVVVLTAALVAALCLTAAAADEDGPIKTIIESLIVSHTISEKDDIEFGVTANGNVDMETGLSLPTMAYTEKDGCKLFALDGEEIDVTEAMAKDGYYEREMEDCVLRVNADGMAAIIVYDENGEVKMDYTVGLNAEGAIATVTDEEVRDQGERGDRGNFPNRKRFGKTPFIRYDETARTFCPGSSFLSTEGEKWYMIEQKGERI